MGLGQTWPLSARLLLLHGVLGMGEEDREGRDHGVEGVLGGPEGTGSCGRRKVLSRLDLGCPERADLGCRVRSP